MHLTGQVAIVTGAGQGIGAAIAAQLAHDGSSVVLCDLEIGPASNLAEELMHEGGRARAVETDVADPDSVLAAVETTRSTFGAPTILVNNAGIDVIGPFAESDEDTWAKLVAVNLLGTIRFSRAVLDAMISAGHGRIINIASDAGKVGSSGEVVYSATKGGIISFSKALAREVARNGVTVNAICPGPTETALLRQVATADQRLYSSLARAIPMRRTAVPDDIAPAVAFLAGDGARYITGQALSVSGGLTMN